MDDSDRRERIALHEANEPLPGHIRGRPRSTMEPFLPDSPDPLVEFLQPKPITCDAVISGLSIKFFDILVVTLHFGSGFRLGKPPIHRAPVDIALLGPSIYLVS